MDHMELKASEDGGDLVAINKTNERVNDPASQVRNTLRPDIKEKLWKRKYDYQRSNTVIDLVNKYIKQKTETQECLKYNRNRGVVERKFLNRDNNENDNDNGEKPTVENNKEPTTKSEEKKKEKPEEKAVGCVTDEDLIRLKPSERKKVDWKGKTYLAPLTTVGNLPFRRICKEFGVDITCGEMAMCTNLLSGQPSEWALLKRHCSETVFGVQICGSYNDTITKACQMIAETCDVDFIDLNVGCPIDLVFNKGAGCALMTRLDHFERIVRSMNYVLDVPFTVKLRTGIKEDTYIAHQLIPEIKSWDVSAITVSLYIKRQNRIMLIIYISKYINSCMEEQDNSATRS